MELVKDFCRKNHLFLLVDAIGSFLADRYDIREYGVNATILSSQKAIALPPGMSFVIVDDKAQERIANNHIRSLYFNFKNYLVDGIRGQTPYTPAVSTLLQLRKRLQSIDEKGVENVINHVALIAKDFRKKILGLPLEIASASLSNTLTPLRPRGKMAADEIFKYLKDHQDIFVCPNGGNLSRELFRVGHIGALTVCDNSTLVNALTEMNERGIL